MPLPIEVVLAAFSSLGNRSCRDPCLSGPCSTTADLIYLFQALKGPHCFIAWHSPLREQYAVHLCSNLDGTMYVGVRKVLLVGYCIVQYRMKIVPRSIKYMSSLATYVYLCEASAPAVAWRGH